MSTVRARLRDIFDRELNLDPQDFTDEISYKSVPEWSSGSHMILIAALEEAYDIEFDPDEIVQLTTIPAIEQALTRRGVANA